MAANLFEQVKALASSEVVNRMAGGIGETPQATERALTGAAIPAILGGLVQRFGSGAGPANLMGVIKQHDPDGKLLDNLGASSGQDIGAIQSTGQGLVSSLFGPRSDSVADVVAGHAGIRKSSAVSILSIAGTMILGFLGQKVVRGGLDAAGLGTMLNGMRGELGRIAPPGLASAMGVPSFAEPAGTYAAGAATATRDTAYREPPTTTEGAGVRRWLPWVVAALVLLGALALFRTCRMAQPPAAPTVTAPRVTTPVVPHPTAPVAPQAPAAPTINAPTAPSAPVQLPSGVQLNLPTNSLAFGLANYLGDSTAPAPPRRFTFEKMRFPTAGATLSSQAETTLNEVADILKAYPNVNVRVEGFTDNSGSPQANMTLSQRRADSVRDGLASRGIDQNRIQTQGFGQASPIASNDT
jgi:OmpA-OmpF porin, OOP family